MRPSIITALFCLAGLSGCTAEESQKIATTADRAAIQSLATAACECALTLSNKDCWTNYEVAVRPFRQKSDGEGYGMATACAPVSTEFDCFKDAEGKFCIVTGYHVNGVKLPNSQLCKQEEAQAIEDGYNAGLDLPNETQADAEKLAKEALAAVRAGKSRPTTSSGQGCV